MRRKKLKSIKRYKDKSTVCIQNKSRIQMASKQETSEKRPCGGCRNNKVFDEKYKTCDDCRGRAVINRAKSRQEVVKCCGMTKDDEPCSYKVSPVCGNKFCMKHQNLWIEENDIEKGITRCNSRTHCPGQKKGIKAILPTGYTLKACKGCLGHAAGKDNERRSGCIEQNDKLVAKKSNMRICYECPEGKNCHLESEMGSKQNGEYSTLCQHHYDERKKVESRRVRIPNKEYYAKYEALPWVKARRKQYRKDHPEVSYKAYTKYRARKLAEDAEAFRKKQAENAKRWRDEHPDKVIEYRKKRKENVASMLSQYEYQAETRGYEFLLTDEKFAKLLNGDCHYCGYNEKEFNGIDRLDNFGDYDDDNCVSCCEICNMMKNTLNKETFILMCAHIAAYNDLCDCERFAHVFNDYNGCDYKTYKRRAPERKIDFSLSEKEFKKIHDRDECYTCGKSNSEIHANGIDRKDNAIGYEYDNCESCCGNCNYLKKGIDYETFLDQCFFVAIYNQEDLETLYEHWTPSNFLEKNHKKLTIEGKTERTEKKNKDRHEKTMSSKTDEAIKKRANEIKKKMARKKSDTSESEELEKDRHKKTISSKIDKTIKKRAKDTKKKMAKKMIDASESDENEEFDETIEFDDDSASENNSFESDTESSEDNRKKISKRK